MGLSSEVLCILGLSQKDTPPLIHDTFIQGDAYRGDAEFKSENISRAISFSFEFFAHLQSTFNKHAMIIS